MLPRHVSSLVLLLGLSACAGSDPGTGPAVPVAAVTVSPATAGPLAPGGTVQLTASVTDAQGNPLIGRPIVWSTANAAVATVSATGLVTAAGPGVVAITATAEGRSGSATVTVQAQVASVAVTPATATLLVGGTQQFTATPQDAAGSPLTGRAIAWSSSNTLIAAVSATGVVTALASGTVTISAASEGRTGTAAVTILVPVASVTVTPATASLLAGGTQQLSASARDASGSVLTGRPVTWSSSAPGVATVSATGLVTAVSVGAATITATVEGQTGTAAITVTPIPVASVAVSPATATITVGIPQQLSAIARDAAGNILTGRPVTWNSGNTNIATVSATGLVTGVTPGVAVITATSEGRTGTAVLTVIPVAVASVTLSPATATLLLGATQQLTTTVRDPAGNVLTGRAVSWASGNTAVATVSASGMVTAAGLGTVTITGTVEERSAVATITVIPVPVATVTINPPTPTLVVGTSRQLQASAQDTAGNFLSGRPVSWTSGSPDIATISATGVVTAVSVGTTEITATVEGRVGSLTLAVVPVPVARVAITPATANVVLGATQQLAATARDAANNVLTGRAVTWQSDNPGVATVSETGLVTGVALGTATVTATVEGQTATAAMTVIPVPVATVAVSPAPTSLMVGATQQLTATTKDAQGNVLADRAVTWATNNASVATVSSTGLVTGVAAGTATITATSEGRSGTSAVTVTLVPVASVTVSPSVVTIAVSSVQQLTATLRDSAGNVLTGRTVTWSSGSTGLATVSAAGVVTGVSPGTATIAATIGAIRGTALVTVVPALATAAGPFLHASGNHTCGLKTDGSLWCWGDNGSGQLGSETQTTTVAIPTPVTGQRTFARVATSNGNPTRSMCALTSAGAAYCWGANESGQLGDGTTTDRQEPTLVSGGLALVGIVMQGGYACGRTSGGVAYCWGANDQGQLGDGSRVERLVPTAVAGGVTFRALGLGNRNYGLSAGGAVYGWGGSTSTFIPTLENWGSDWAQLTVGPEGRCLLTPIGAASCWGVNASGDLGLPGGAAEATQPTAVVGGLAFRQVTKGRAHTCGLTTTGLAYCWGSNAFGQVGDETTTDRGVPTAVAGSQVFVEIAAGADHTCASTSAGDVWCWGRNASGQLGEGTSTTRRAPAQVPSFSVRVP